MFNNNISINCSINPLQQLQQQQSNWQLIHSNASAYSTNNITAKLTLSTNLTESINKPTVVVPTVAIDTTGNATINHRLSSARHLADILAGNCECATAANNSNQSTATATVVIPQQQQKSQYQYQYPINTAWTSEYANFNQSQPSIQNPNQSIFNHQHHQHQQLQYQQKPQHQQQQHHQSQYEFNPLNYYHNQQNQFHHSNSFNQFIQRQNQIKAQLQYPHQQQQIHQYQQQQQQSQYNNIKSKSNPPESVSESISEFEFYSNGKWESTIIENQNNNSQSQYAAAAAASTVGMSNLVINQLLDNNNNKQQQQHQQHSISQSNSEQAYQDWINRSALNQHQLNSLKHESGPIESNSINWDSNISSAWSILEYQEYYT